MDIALLTTGADAPAIEHWIRGAKGGPYAVRHLPLATLQDSAGPLEARVNELLAEPDVGAVIVLSRCAAASAAVRQAAQAGLPVLCLVPVEASLDVHYELAVLAEQAGARLYPYWPQRLDPCYEQLRARAHAVRSAPTVLDVILGAETAQLAFDPGFLLANALAAGMGYLPEEVLALRDPDGTVRVVGERSDGHTVQFLVKSSQEPGFRVSLRSETESRPELCWRCSERCRLESAHATLSDHATDDAERRLVQAFLQAAGGSEVELATWDELLRALEVAEAVRRSLGRRRAVTVRAGLASPETQFKAAMTMWGCGLLSALVVLLPAIALLEFIGLRGHHLAMAILVALLVALGLFLLAQFLKPPAQN